ncbi:MAG: PQQ-dependent sugar dehydrogenase [Chloroflexota bacterium]|nr:PQQ-dependent sugar dehydrogenase [Chloroflexota bacterium]
MPAGSASPPAAESQPTAKPSAERASTRDRKVRAEVYLNGLQLPSSLAFAPDGRLFLVEVNAGRVRVSKDGVLQEQPVATFPVQQASESGLLGLALDPDFDANHYVYVYYSEADPARPDHGIRNRVVRFVERDGRGTDFAPVLDDLPANAVGAMDAHQGGALGFGPDGKLYVTVGDTGRSELAQDLTSLAGKVLRVNPDGSIPLDNPFPGSPVYALGLRNPWGIAVHPRTGSIYLSENGNKAHDKVLLLRPGANYGWPVVESVEPGTAFTPAVWDSGDAADARNGMAALMIYGGSMFPDHQGRLFFCAFKSGHLKWLTLAGPELEYAADQDRLDAECRLGLTEGPDGAIYASSIDKVRRLTPRSAA